LAKIALYGSLKELVESHPPEQIAKLIDGLANQAFALIEANTES
jgi:hypothetical protein